MVKKKQKRHEKSIRKTQYLTLKVFDKILNFK